MVAAYDVFGGELVCVFNSHKVSWMGSRFELCQILSIFPIYFSNRRATFERYSRPKVWVHFKGKHFCNFHFSLLFHRGQILKRKKFAYLRAYYFLYEFNSFSILSFRSLTSILDSIVEERKRGPRNKTFYAQRA